MYTGIANVTCNTDEEFAKLYEHPESFGFYVNQYILVKDKDEKIVDKKRWDGNSLVSLKYKTINNMYMSKFKPLNVEQELAFDLMQNNDITGKLLTSPYGGGKTIISIAHALDKVIGNKPEFDRIVFLRNMQLVKDMGNHQLGSLPGSLSDKLKPFLMPVADILGSVTELENLMASERIVAEFEGFIRGRSYTNSFIFLTEAENQTREQIALIMSRVGKGSVLVVEGDMRQVDRDVYAKDAGMTAMSEKLRGHRLFGMVTLQKNERSEFSTLSDLLLEK